MGKKAAKETAKDASLARECREFLARYRELGFPSVESDALYCLPNGLRSCIHDAEGSSGLFHGPKGRFEADFAGWCGRSKATGIFADRPIPLGLLDMTHVEQRNRNRLSHRKYERQRRRMPSGTSRPLAVPKVYIAPPDAAMKSQLRAYASWLSMSEAYQADLRKLKKYLHRSGVMGNGFPAPVSPGQSTEVPGWNSDSLTAYVDFCRKWCLSGLLSWDLPMPMSPGPVASSGDGRQFLEGMGMQVFLPVTLAASGRYLAAAVAGWRDAMIQVDRRDRKHWKHLRRWLDGSYKKRAVGIDYGDLFLVKHFWATLAGRYELEGRTMGLYEAFGRFLEGEGARPKTRPHDPGHPHRPGFEKVRKMVAHLRRARSR